MPVVESTPTRLVLKSGSTTLTLDKNTGQASHRRKIIFWASKPSETALSKIAKVTTDMAVDRASGVEVWHTMLILDTGEGWAFPSANKQDADGNVTAIRQFLNLP